MDTLPQGENLLFFEENSLISFQVLDDPRQANQINLHDCSFGLRKKEPFSNGKLISMTQVDYHSVHYRLKKKRKEKLLM